MKNPGIYILTNRFDGKQYVGKDGKLPRRPNQHLNGKDNSCKHIHNAIMKYGKDAFHIEIVRYPNISPEALAEVEKWKIRQLDSFHNGYNLTEGGDGTSGYKHTAEFKAKIGQLNRQHNLRRISDGTHKFLDGNISREVQRQRVADGTHNFLGGDIQREVHRRRISDGTHKLLRKNNPRAHPEYPLVFVDYIFFSPNTSLEVVRRFLYSKYPHILKSTIWRWVRKWQSEISE